MGCSLPSQMDRTCFSSTACSLEMEGLSFGRVSCASSLFFFSSSERNSHRAIFCCLKCRCRNQPSLRYASCEIPTAALVFPADPLLRFSFSYQASVLHALLLLQLLCHTIPPPRALSPAQIHAEGWPREQLSPQEPSPDTAGFT